VSPISGSTATEVMRLFLDSASSLFSYARTLPQVDSFAADDLVQETFHDAALSWHKLAGRDAEGRRKWLFAAVRNKAIDQWRRDIHCTPSPTLIELSSSGEDIVHRVLCKAALERCWALIQRMPPVRQKVAFLRWSEDWTTAEIAGWLAISQATVRGHLKVARDELMIQVGAEVPFIGDPEIDEGG
jgi:RNA polymerase sigma factor (sigma-70 family)